MKRNEKTPQSYSRKNKLLRNFDWIFGTNWFEFMNEISDNIDNKTKCRKNSNEANFVSISIYNAKAGTEQIQFF